MGVWCGFCMSKGSTQHTLTPHPPTPASKPLKTKVVFLEMKKATKHQLLEQIVKWLCSDCTWFMCNITTKEMKYQRDILLEYRLLTSPGRGLSIPYKAFNDRKRSFYDRIRPFFGILHVPVLRSYFYVTVYGEIRCETGIAYGLRKRGS